MKKNKFIRLFIFAFVFVLFLSAKQTTFAIGQNPQPAGCGDNMTPGLNAAGQHVCIPLPIGGSTGGGITNPSIPNDLGGSPDAANNGSIFTHYFIVIWQAIIVIGTLAMLFNLTNGAMEWITAGGQTDKVSHGRQKMTEGIVGLIILVGSYVLVMYIGQIFKLNLLSITLPTP